MDSFSSNSSSGGGDGGGGGGGIAQMRAYASARRYSRIEDEEQQRPGCGGQQEVERGGVFVWRRVAGGLAVCLGFAAAVSGSSLYTTRISRGSSSSAGAANGQPSQMQSGVAGTSYGGNLTSLKVRAAC